MHKFEALQELGAGDFQHLNGTLEAHLKGTELILEQWGASEVLQVAGLFHAAYGTAGFDENMVSLNQRHEISKVIGSDAEALVYLYCSCDRDYVFPQFSQKGEIQFKDRFTGLIFPLEASQANQFCELTVANELELVYSSEDFKQSYGKVLLELFVGMDEYLSQEAQKSYKSALNEFI